MSVSKKIQELVKDSVDYGINQALPEFMIFFVHAKARRLPQRGWAVIGATTKKEAKEIAQNDGWLHTARVVSVYTFEEYCKGICYIDNPDEEYNRLKKLKKLPKKIRDWHELEWGI